MTEMSEKPQALIRRVHFVGAGEKDLLCIDTRWEPEEAQWRAIDCRASWATGEKAATLRLGDIAYNAPWTESLVPMPEWWNNPPPSEL